MDRTLRGFVLMQAVGTLASWSGPGLLSLPAVVARLGPVSTSEPAAGGAQNRRAPRTLRFHSPEAIPHGPVPLNGSGQAWPEPSPSSRSGLGRFPAQTRPRRRFGPVPNALPMQPGQEKDTRGRTGAVRSGSRRTDYARDVPRIPPPTKVGGRRSAAEPGGRSLAVRAVGGPPTWPASPACPPAKREEEGWGDARSAHGRRGRIRRARSCSRNLGWCGWGRFPGRSRAWRGCGGCRRQRRWSGGRCRSPKPC